MLPALVPGLFSQRWLLSWRNLRCSGACRAICTVYVVHMRCQHLPAGGRRVIAANACCNLQVLEAFKKLGIKTVPVTLKSSPLAKAAIRIILGELICACCAWGAQRHWARVPCHSLLCI